MTAPEVNVPLLRKVLEHITAHPEEWDQSWWAVKSSKSPCGTACCVAGWAVSFAGYDFRWDEEGAARSAMSLKLKGMTLTIPEVARQLLGITDTQSFDLFFSGNSLKTLWRVANRLTDGEIEIPEEFQ